jgi:CHASE2 domain-containing sensor protein
MTVQPVKGAGAVPSVPPGTTTPPDAISLGIPDWLTDLPGVAEADKIGSVITAAVAALFDYRMWRSLGWLWLGLWLMIFALGLWLKQPIEAGIGTTLGAALKAP